MEREYTTTRNNHTALWWTLGALAVLFILWLAFFRGDNMLGIPNTGVDDSAAAINGTENYNTDNSVIDNGTNPDSAITEDAKG
jgi:hypothetical protein